MLYGEPDYRRRLREKAEKQQHGADAERHEAAQDARIEKIILSVEQLAQQITRYADENSPENRRKWRWEKAEVFGLWVAAGVGLAAILVGSSDSYHQRTVMQGQLDEMRTEQRGWVKITPESIKVSVFNHPKDVKPDPRFARAIFDVIFGLKNVGHSPVFGIRITTYGFVPGKQEHLPFAERAKRCAQERQVPLDNIWRGTVLFPGAHIRDVDMVPEAHEVTEIDSGDAPPGKSVPVYIIACADYGLSPAAKEHHQTDVIYRVTHVTHGPDGDSLSDLFDFEQPITAGDLRIFPITGGWAD